MCKKTVTILVLLGSFLLTLFALRKQSQSTHCDGLFRGGAYRNSTLSEEWQPEGCSLKIYTQRLSAMCFDKIAERSRDATGNNRSLVVFIGDSRVQQLAFGFIAHLGGKLQSLPNKTQPVHNRKPKHHYDENHLVSSATMQFIWTEDIFQATKKIKSFCRHTLLTKEYPVIVVLGNGIWTAMYCTNRNISKINCLRHYRRMLDDMLPLLSRLADHSKVIWVPQNKIFPMHSVKYHQEVNSSGVLNSYNDIARSVLESPSAKGRIIYWTSYESIFRLEDSYDGIHIGTIAQFFDVHVILNSVCNEFIEVTDNRDNYCCSTPVYDLFDNSWFNGVAPLFNTILNSSYV